MRTNRHALTTDSCEAPWELSGHTRPRHLLNEEALGRLDSMAAQRGRTSLGGEASEVDRDTLGCRECLEQQTGRIQEIEIHALSF